MKNKTKSINHFQHYNEEFAINFVYYLICV